MQPRILLGSKKAKQNEAPKKKKKKRNTTLSFARSQTHFFCSQPCAAATPPHPDLTAFNLLPFLSCRTDFEVFVRRKKWAPDSGLGGRNGENGGRDRLTLASYLLFFSRCRGACSFLVFSVF